MPDTASRCAHQPVVRQRVSTRNSAGRSWRGGAHLCARDYGERVRRQRNGGNPIR